MRDEVVVSRSEDPWVTLDGLKVLQPPSQYSTDFFHGTQPTWNSVWYLMWSPARGFLKTTSTIFPSNFSQSLVMWSCLRILQFDYPCLFLFIKMVPLLCHVDCIFLTLKFLSVTCRISQWNSHKKHIFWYIQIQNVFLVVLFSPLKQKTHFS